MSASDEVEALIETFSDVCSEADDATLIALHLAAWFLQHHKPDVSEVDVVNRFCGLVSLYPVPACPTPIDPARTRFKFQRALYLIQEQLLQPLNDMDNMPAFSCLPTYDIKTWISLEEMAPTTPTLKLRSQPSQGTSTAEDEKEHTPQTRDTGAASSSSTQTVTHTPVAPWGGWLPDDPARAPKQVANPTPYRSMKSVHGTHFAPPYDPDTDPWNDPTPTAQEPAASSSTSAPGHAAGGLSSAGTAMARDAHPQRTTMHVALRISEADGTVHTYAVDVDLRHSALPSVEVQLLPYQQG